MVPCQQQLCTLRPEYMNLLPDDQAAMELACKIADAAAYRACQVKQKALAEWITDGE